MTRLWRCVPSKYLKESYDGRGGLFVDGRWHNAGRPIVYASLSPGTAVLEALVNVGNLQALLATYVLVGADLPDELIMEAKAIPADWNSIPFRESTQIFGDDWLEKGDSAAIRVPSAVVPDHNVLLNPAHAEFKQLQVDKSPIQWYPRLIA